MPRNRRSERAMAKKRILRRGLYFLVGILVGAPLMLVGFATDAHARHHHGTHAVHFVPPGTTAPMLKRDAANGPRPPHDRGAPRTVGAPPNTLIGTGAGKGGKQPSGDSTGTGAPAKDANAPDFHTKDIEPIDTRITLQPRLHGAGPGTVRQAKSKIGPVGSRHPYTPHAFTPGKAAHITRNAIGLSIAPRSVAPTHNAGLVRSPTGAVPGGNDGVAKPNPSLDHFPSPSGFSGNRDRRSSPGDQWKRFRPPWLCPSHARWTSQERCHWYQRINDPPETLSFG